MSRAEKVAFTLPAQTFRGLERVRKRLRLNRSEAISQAIAIWLGTHDGDPRIEAYLRGYRTHPDDPKDAVALVEAWTDGMDCEDW
jgi:hypothetical protein